MSGWSAHKGLAVGLPMDNIDTDQLIPARFMSAPRSAGYGGFLLHDLRFDADADSNGAARAFPPMEGASIIVAGRNFGGGSSREAAVYALVDFGVRAVIAPGFGDIFAANAVNNGLAPLTVDGALAADLLARLKDAPAAMSLDLKAETVTLGDLGGGFRLNPIHREKLINGWDDIDLTARRGRAIAAFQEKLTAQEAWTAPRRD